MTVLSGFSNMLLSRGLSPRVV